MYTLHYQKTSTFYLLENLFDEIHSVFCCLYTGASCTQKSWKKGHNFVQTTFSLKITSYSPWSVLEIALYSYPSLQTLSYCLIKQGYEAEVRARTSQSSLNKDLEGLFGALRVPVPAPLSPVISMDDDPPPAVAPAPLAAPAPAPVPDNRVKVGCRPAALVRPRVAKPRRIAKPRQIKRNVSGLLS